MKTTKPGFLCLFLSLTALLVAPAGAQTTNTAPAARHSLWKVQGEKSVVYLLGSVHILKPEHYPLPTVIESAFTNARVAVFETDIEALESPLVALKIMAKAKLPEGETLRDQLSPAVYASFTNHLNAAGLPETMFSPLTPVMAATTLVMLELQRLNFDPEFGLDKHFYPRAKADGKRLIPLETADFQISLLTDMSKAEGELVMKTTLRDLDKLKLEFADLLKAWQTGDAVKLDAFLNEAKQEAPAIFKRLLTDRNRNWLPKIEALLRGDQTAIVIVGAGHLVGKEGLVELLKQKEYKVTQE